MEGFASLEFENTMLAVVQGIPARISYFKQEISLRRTGVLPHRHIDT